MKSFLLLLILAFSAFAQDVKFSANGSVTVTATYVALPDKQARMVTVVNDTGKKIGVRYGGSGDYFPLVNGAGYTFRGLSNTNELQIANVEDSTSVTVRYNLENY